MWSVNDGAAGVLPGTCNIRLSAIFCQRNNQLKVFPAIRLEQEIPKIQSFGWQVSCGSRAKSLIQAWLTEHMVQEQVNLHLQGKGLDEQTTTCVLYNLLFLLKLCQNFKPSFQIVHWSNKTLLR